MIWRILSRTFELENIIYNRTTQEWFCRVMCVSLSILIDYLMDMLLFVDFGLAVYIKVVFFKLYKSGSFCFLSRGHPLTNVPAQPFDCLAGLFRTLLHICNSTVFILCDWRQ